MNQTTQSPKEFLTLTENFDRATSRNNCQIIQVEFGTIPSPTPSGYTSIADLVKEWEQDDEMRVAMGEARQWIADTFYNEEGDTVRTLRLRKGWSQARLAEMLGTSQSHIARIERGTDNLTLETLRKLSDALGIDLNTLNNALKRQEAITQAKNHD